MDLTQEQKPEQTILDRLYARFEHFYDLDPNLTLSHIMGLLYIKQHQDRLEGVTNSNLTEKLALSPSGATRNDLNAAKRLGVFLGLLGAYEWTFPELKAPGCLLMPGSIKCNVTVAQTIDVAHLSCSKRHKALR